MKTPTLILLSVLTSVVFGQKAESLRFMDTKRGDSVTYYPATSTDLFGPSTDKNKLIDNFQRRVFEPKRLQQSPFGVDSCIPIFGTDSIGKKSGKDASETSLPTFSDKLLQPHELPLSQAIATGQLPPANIQPEMTLASVRRLAEQGGRYVSKMPIISPSGNVDPNMPILAPDPSINFRMQVVEPKVDSVK